MKAYLEIPHRTGKNVIFGEPFSPICEDLRSTETFDLDQLVRAGLKSLTMPFPLLDRVWSFIKKFNPFLIYISIPVVLYYFYSQNLLSVQVPDSTAHITMALIFVFLAFIIHSLYWYYLLSASDIQVSKRDAIISNGLYVFTKYIPGKVWLILGKAGFISNRYDYPLSDMSLLSFYNQILGIFVGLCFGVVTVLILPFELYVKVVVPIGVFALGLLLFYSPFRDFVSKYIRNERLLRLIGRIPKLEKLNVTIIYVICYWLCLSIGFLFIVDSLILSSQQALKVVFGYPTSVVVGIMAIFAPGGIGIREGAMAYVLFTAGIATADSVSIVLLSRVWFVLGEIFIFLLALSLNKLSLRAIN